jgi:hypothetical protein
MMSRLAASGSRLGHRVADLQDRDGFRVPRDGDTQITKSDNGKHHLSKSSYLVNKNFSRQMSAISAIRGMGIYEKGFYPEFAVAGRVSLMTTIERIRRLCGELLAAQNDEAIFRILPELREARQEAIEQRRNRSGSDKGNGRMAA